MEIGWPSPWKYQSSWGPWQPCTSKLRFRLGCAILKFIFFFNSHVFSVYCVPVLGEELGNLTPPAGPGWIPAAPAGPSSSGHPRSSPWTQFVTINSSSSSTVRLQSHLAGKVPVPQRRGPGQFAGAAPRIVRVAVLGRAFYLLSSVSSSVWVAASPLPPASRLPQPSCTR